MRVFLLSVGAIALAGCATSGNITTVTSNPSGALVKIDGSDDCETPCTIQLSTPLDVTIAKAGYKPQSFVLQPGKGRVKVELELSAPTTGVEESGLPSL